MKSLWISDKNNLYRFESLQAYYTIAGRDLERELVPLIQDQQLGLMVWSPLAGGFLSGKFNRNGEGPEGSRRAAFDFPPVDKERAFNILDVMRDIGRNKNVSIARIALAWLLKQPWVTSIIIGAKNDSQLKDNLAAPDIEFTDKELKQLDEVSALPPEYPGWMVKRQAGQRYPEPPKKE